MKCVRGLGYPIRILGAIEAIINHRAKGGVDLRGEAPIRRDCFGVIPILLFAAKCRFHMGCTHAGAVRQFLPEAI
jgi:hypothetical protein